MKHAKHNDAPETRGKTIHWPRLYDLLVNVMWLGREKKMRAATLALARLQPGENVLDVGCGTGTLALAAKVIVGSGGQVCGIDAAPEMVERAQRKAQVAGLDAQFQSAAVEKLPFPDRSFDLVVSSLMLHHLPKDLRGQALQEMHRVLKPSGRLLVVDFEPPKGFLGRFFVHAGLGRRMSHNDVRLNLPLLETAGFREIRGGPTGAPMLSYLFGQKAASDARA